MRKLKGVVTSNKMIKTVVVRIDRLKKHPKYQKYFRVSEKFKAHDENGDFKVGDEVMIQETRPISKDKRWKVIELIKREAEEKESDVSVEQKDL